MNPSRVRRTRLNVLKNYMNVNKDGLFSIGIPYTYNDTDLMITKRTCFSTVNTPSF